MQLFCGSLAKFLLLAKSVA